MNDAEKTRLCGRVVLQILGAALIGNPVGDEDADTIRDRPHRFGVVLNDDKAGPAAQRPAWRRPARSWPRWHLVHVGLPGPTRRRPRHLPAPLRISTSL